jgi:hypothetical protein
MENVTIERRGPAFAFKGGVSMFDLLVPRCAVETFLPVVHAFVAQSA